MNINKLYNQYAAWTQSWVETMTQNEHGEGLELYSVFQENQMSLCFFVEKLEVVVLTLWVTNKNTLSATITTRETAYSPSYKKFSRIFADIIRYTHSMGERWEQEEPPQ